MSSQTIIFVDEGVDSSKYFICSKGSRGARFHLLEKGIVTTPIQILRLQTSWNVDKVVIDGLSEDSPLQVFARYRGWDVVVVGSNDIPYIEILMDLIN